jgi:hypothetical protein
VGDLALAARQKQVAQCARAQRALCEGRACATSGGKANRAGGDTRHGLKARVWRPRPSVLRRLDTMGGAGAPARTHQ